MKNFSIKYIESCNSTNDELIKLASLGYHEGTSILSFNQTNGRGKRGNKWISQAGNIFLSTLLQPSLSKKYWHQISLLSSFSVFQGLIEIGVDKEHLKIKWPNDIMLNFRKICGILLESIGNNLIIGIGININSHPSNMLLNYETDDLSSYGFFNNTMLKKISNIILQKLYYNYKLWLKKKLEFCHKDINSNLAFLNHQIKFSNDGHYRVGTIYGVSKEGYFQVSTNSKIIKLLSCDYYLVRNGEDNVFVN